MPGKVAVGLSVPNAKKYTYRQWKQKLWFNLGPPHKCTKRHQIFINACLPLPWCQYEVNTYCTLSGRTLVPCRPQFHCAMNAATRLYTHKVSVSVTVELKQEEALFSLVSVPR